METATEYKYIVKKEITGEPIIQHTRISVRDIIEQWRLGSSPEQITESYPHISLSQVYEALAYYHDNREDIEHYIELNNIPENVRGTRLS